MSTSERNGSTGETDSSTARGAVAPTGINHVVLKVRDIEKSHAFWTEIMGFTPVGKLTPSAERPNPPRMRFYSGLNGGSVSHHDLALLHVDEDDAFASSGSPAASGLLHVAITWPDRDSWLEQIAHLQRQGVPFDRRINHGMTHSLYITDPDGHGVELLYELPDEVWEGDINAALNYVSDEPTEGPEALVDRTENPVFGGD